MKKFTLIAILAIVCSFAYHASAQAYSPITLSVPSTLSNGTTNLASAPVIGPLKQQNVAVAVDLTATAKATNTFTFYRSVDGLKWDAGTTYTLTAITSDGSEACTVSNYNVGGIGYLKLYSIQTASAGTVTNNSVKYGLKQGSP